MKRSASDWWSSRAAEQGTTLPKLIRRVLEEKAERPTSYERYKEQVRGVLGPDVQFSDDVSPNFKKGEKK
jgi:hypothetical protein